MTHISLDGADESVKRFVLAMASEPNGAVLEMDGKTVAFVVTFSPGLRGGSLDRGEEPRAAVTSSTAGTRAGSRPRRRSNWRGCRTRCCATASALRPLPLEDARRLHQELLTRAGTAGGA